MLGVWESRNQENIIIPDLAFLFIKILNKFCNTCNAIHAYHATNYT
jgi:hypothetical protein